MPQNTVLEAAKIRRDALEEAARVCEQHPKAGMSSSRFAIVAGMACAEAIRMLARDLQPPCPVSPPPLHGTVSAIFAKGGTWKDVADALGVNNGVEAQLKYMQGGAIGARRGRRVLKWSEERIAEAQELKARLGTWDAVGKAMGENPATVRVSVNHALRKTKMGAST